MPVLQLPICRVLVHMVLEGVRLVSSTRIGICPKERQVLEVAANLAQRTPQ
jgi:hypothetical protein